MSKKSYEMGTLELTEKITDLSSEMFRLGMEMEEHIVELQKKLGYK